MIQYVIHTLMLFILFLYWDVLKNVTVEIMMKPLSSPAPSDGTCPVTVGRNIRGVAYLLNVHICPD